MSITRVSMICIFELKLFKCLRKIGNKENHSTAKESRPKTPVFVLSREANKTDANIAALVDNDPVILAKSMSYRIKVEVRFYFMAFVCVL